MAVVIGTAGGSARRNAQLGRFALPVVIVLMSAIVLAALTWYSQFTGAKRAIGFLFIAAESVYFLWKDRAWYFELLNDFSQSNSWMQGSEGERRVGTHLNSLPDDYVVFHDFRPTDSEGQLRPWNVDHIVVGPTGVFVIETKMYSQARIFPAAQDSKTAKNVRQVSLSAIELKNKLVLWSGGALSGTFVEAILVYAQDKAFVEKLREGSTHVLPLQYLLKNVMGRPKQDVSQEQAFRVARALIPALPERTRRDFATEITRLDGLYATAKGAAKGIGATRTASHNPASDCPRCGAPLMRRVAKKGRYKGRAFMACSRWSLTGCAYKMDIQT